MQNSLTKSKSVVAFIDILGFKEIVKSNEKSNDNKVIYKLKNAFEQSYKKSIALTRNWLNEFNELSKDIDSTNIQHKQFSDNIYLSYDYKDDNSDFELAVYLITFISAYYQRIMLEKGFYVRGGISLGSVYFDDYMIFSNALIKAYELETKIAKYPRIVIDEDILKQLDKIGNLNLLKTLTPKLIVKDWTGLAFLNPFKILEITESIMSKAPEVVKELDKIAESKPQLREMTANLEPDLNDEYLAGLVLDRIKMKLKKHKEDKEICEKYLWLREFVKWQFENKSNLEFKYYK